MESLTPTMLASGAAAVVVISAALGYLVAAWQSSRQRSELSTALELAKAELEALSSQHSALDTELDQANAALQVHAVELGKAEAKIDALVASEARLERELAESKETVAARQKKIEELTSQRYEEGQRLQAAETSLRELRNSKAELQAEYDVAKAKSDELTAELRVAREDQLRLATAQEEREESHAREVANFEKQKQSLSEHFKVLSNEILEQRANSLKESSKLTLAEVMNPFKETVDSFKKEVQEIHHRETSQQGELRKELEQLKQLNQKITTEAHELSTALRGQKKLQGNWGELVLENVLDRSGLRLGVDYRREVSVTTEDGRKRPDVVVDLPQNKHLIIDSKVSLSAYTRYVNADNDVEREQALKEHVTAVASRIKELADKDYFKLPGLNSPEMVFMFIPIESAFVEALRADETLFQKAIENNVLVATPTTLLTSLNIVRQLWRYEDQNKHTAALANKAEAVFNKLNTFLNSFEDVKKGLDRASAAYVKAEGQLLSGKGNLVKQVGEFKNLAPAIKGSLPSHFTEKAALEIDFVVAEQREDVVRVAGEAEE